MRTFSSTRCIRNSYYVNQLQSKFKFYFLLALFQFVLTLQEVFHQITSQRNFIKNDFHQYQVKSLNVVMSCVNDSPVSIRDRKYKCYVLDQLIPQHLREAVRFKVESRSLGYTHKKKQSPVLARYNHRSPPPPTFCL